MRCWLWVAFLLNTVAGGVCPAGAGEARIDGTASAEILPGDVPGLRLIGRDFLRRSLYAGEGASRDFLIEIESRSELPLAETDDIAPPPRHRLMIRELSGKTIGPILRTLELAANDIRIDRLPLVEAETWGCCVQANTIALYNLLDGRLVAARSTDFDVLTATRLAPGGEGATGYQVFTFKSIEPLYDALVSPDPASLGVITLVREDVPVQRIELRLAQGDPLPGEQVDWLNAVQWLDAARKRPQEDLHIVYDAGKPPGFSYLWTLDETRRIAIPFDGERLDIARAEVPARFRLVERPPQP